MKQELFILRQLQQNNNKQNVNEESHPVHPSRLKPSTKPPKTNYTEREASPTKPNPDINSPRIPQPQTKPPSKTQRASNVGASVTPETKKTLLIGDSISGNVDIDALEKAVSEKIRVAKAYSAVYDVGNTAKAAARYPSKNFKDVIPAELSKDSYENLILQAGSIDITNLNTKDDPERYLSFFKQEVVISAQNLFSSAVSALQTYQSLKKVVIMNQVPRYDPISVDPLSLKPALAVLFNNTLVGAWIDSPLKERISIGAHSLECAGGVQEARYWDMKTNKYDGVHLYGPSGRKAYTISVLNILRVAGILDVLKEQFSSANQFYSNIVQLRYQNGKQSNNEMPRHTAEKDTDMRPMKSKDAANDRDIRKQNHQKSYRYEYPVPTFNRFDHLN